MSERSTTATATATSAGPLPLPPPPRGVRRAALASPGVEDEDDEDDEEELLPLTGFAWPFDTGVALTGVAPKKKE